MNLNTRRFQGIFLIGGLLLLILGIRIFIGIRFVSLNPELDDWATLDWLQHWSDGIHDWGHFFARNNNHPLCMILALELGQYLLNGYYDSRLGFLAFSFIHTLYAAFALILFKDILTPKDRGWLLALGFFLFAVPFAGYRISWGGLWPHAAMMLFSLWAFYVSVHYLESWLGVFFAFLLSILAALNMGEGCLTAFMVASLTLFRTAIRRRITLRESVLSIGCVALFLSFYLTMGSEQTHPRFWEISNAFLKALAWPVIFTSWAGFFTLVPAVGLGFAYIYSPIFRTRNVEFLLGVGGLLILIALATGVARGDSENMGMPSGRYLEVFIMVPLFCAAALCALYRGSVGFPKHVWGIFAWIWICVQVFGFSIHIFYRTLPFIARENGEWTGAIRQVIFREMSRGVDHAYFLHFDPLWDVTVDSLLAVGMMKGQEPLPALTLQMITGFNVWPGSQGNYIVEGYHPAYQPRPAQLYMGSFDLDHRSLEGKWFLSAPFRPVANYITMDVLVDKSARLTNYRMNGLQLVLRDETTGTRTDLLPQLAHRFPFVFRDWEIVYARVTPGDQYRIESYTDGPKNWIAFGEPFESGRLTPFTIMATQSGKLLCLCGLGMLMLALGLYFLEKEADPKLL